jgi:diaminohydroxyphosphoribosylaminopyrimidine deaminase/5-amino-6-(5-phosphoribosylamino)uracil reductase
MNPRDHIHMAHALRLAARGLYSTDPNPRVGCVVVTGDGAVAGEGWHEFAGGPHAEVHALRKAGEWARGATAYVTLEPCSHHGRTPPCSQALVRAGVARVVAAMVDPNPEVSGKGLEALRAAGIQVDCGLMATQAEALNPGFIARMRRGRPYVVCKVGASIDGRTAMADGASRWITSEAARRDAQRLRARSSAILTGIGTVLKDDPALTVRDAEIVAAAPPGAGGVRQPLRVVADSQLRMPVTARMLSEPGATLIATTMGEAAGRATLPGVEMEVVPAVAGKVDLAALLDRLAERKVNEVLVEAGAALNGALLAAGLIDELVMYIAPRIMSDGARGMFHLPGLDRLDQSVPLVITDVRSVGPDLRVTARIGSER